MHKCRPIRYPVITSYSIHYTKLYDSPLKSLAQLGKARVTKSRKEYEKFFEMWKDADEDLPDLIAAKKEYAALN